MSAKAVRRHPLRPAALALAVLGLLPGHTGPAAASAAPAAESPPRALAPAPAHASAPAHACAHAAASSGASATAHASTFTFAGTLTDTFTGTLTDPSTDASAPVLRPDGDGQCTIPSEVIKGTPWSLRRVLLDQLWQHTRGEGVTVAVIDTGVDDRNPQLAGAVDARRGRDFIGAKGDGTFDPVGHGTKVAGIIAARPAKGTGFVGIAPGATILPIRQNDDRNRGRARTMALAIRHAVDRKARVINVSQDTTKPLEPDSELARAVRYAVERDVVVVASAGNGGADGRSRNTYPAALPGVLAVAASDRNNERAPFSQPGGFVGVAAPGVDMVSTVPVRGQCADDGTSFSAPYVAGVAALIRAKHPRWTNANVIAQIQQTAQRAGPGHDRFLGWGVVDPVKALTEDAGPITEPTPDAGPATGRDQRIVPVELTDGEPPQERRERIAVYVVGGGLVTGTLLVAGSVTVRDRRRRSPAA